MLPFLMMKALVHEHVAEARSRSLRPVMPERSKGPTRRERLGWLLVEIGLRMAAAHRVVAVQKKDYCCDFPADGSLA